LFSDGADEFSSKNNPFFTNNFANRGEAAVTNTEDETGIDKPEFFCDSLNNQATKEISRTQERSFKNEITSFDDEVDGMHQNNESIDFDLSPFATDTEELKETDEGVAAKTHEIEGFHKFDSFDFDSNDKQTKVTDDMDCTITEDDFDGSNLRGDLLNDKTTDSDYSFVNNFFDGDYKDDLDKPTIELKGQDFIDQDKFDVFDLTDMDQLETKLDLAKAYIDMSDADAAKDMAWQVLKKGTTEQKKIAQALLNDLK
jgi:pilus assembly protein FimV